MFSLISYMVSTYIYLFSLGFKHTDCFSVYKKEIVGFKVVFKQSFTYGDGG